MATSASSPASPQAIAAPANAPQLDERLATLHDNRHTWARLPLSEKIAMTRRLLERTVDVAPRQVEAALNAKRIPDGSPLAGEEWLGGPVVTARNLRLLIETLEDIDRHGKPQLKNGALRTRHDGQVIVDVFPLGTLDKLMYQGFTAEVWMQPEVTPSNLPDHTASFYDRDLPEGRVALVLGAGNVASIGPLDVVYKLFAEGQVCILKMNPVNDYLGPFIEEAFAEFIERGFLAMAYGGADVGAYLCHHPIVEDIHITGSDITHDAIVYGTGPEGDRRKANDEPLLTKRITSELGNVSPIIVTPGNWSDSELQFQAENVATQLANNGGFNCNAARVLITHKDWPQRETFLNTLRGVLSDIDKRVAYYPGAEQRFDTFINANDQAELFGPREDGILPWGLIPNVPADDTDNVCFTTESFCGVMCETSLDAASPSEFLKHATDFCNERLWGTLSASILIDPRTQRSEAAALEQAIAELRYGSVVVNHWPAVSYGLGVTPWGAFPGHTYQDIGSGIGVVHNTFLFDKPEKSVIRGPFKAFPRPPWFVTTKNTAKVAERLTRFELNPGLARFAGVLTQALRG
ncbi:aldehyde dehydrogenase family protein [Lujinxingia sediminis]|uniref:Aldehyde dehydrogenase family protein n=1 Tax=Lujinxingia sediminis TaxID=2480984 RepID=A0ABY0CXM9_9DELT|nr:aldehyde dehydrogenase family protein [Lujinxingia sediminis]RVU48648.1 aldehyde dehydrogenase family protein [Lujinxingia sediminis]